MQEIGAAVGSNQVVFHLEPGTDENCHVSSWSTLFSPHQGPFQVEIKQSSII